MRVRAFAVVAAAILAFVSLASTPHVLRAQSSPPASDDTFVPSVWVAESGGLLKLAAADGHLLLEIGEAAGVRAVAVDERGLH